jgi:hypothetical protein
VTLADRSLHDIVLVLYFCGSQGHEVD